MSFVVTVSTHCEFFADRHRMQETNLHGGGDRGDAVREQAVRHRTVEQRGDNPAVANTGIPFPFTIKCDGRLNPAIRGFIEDQVKAMRTVGIAGHAARVMQIANLRQWQRFFLHG